MKIFLASGSPRRIELLKWMGLSFEVIGHRVDESRVEAKRGEDLVAELAMQKANNPALQLNEEGSELELLKVRNLEGLVIGSDLTVELEGKQLGKPKDKKEAKKMLKYLGGKSHSVWCGVAVVDSKVGEGRLSVCETKVKMKNYDQEIIDRYVKKFELMDKGGGYSIRYELKGYGSLVEKIEGSYTNVLGLPLHYLENLLKEFGVKLKKDWRKICKKETGYEN
ncbi:MAG: Maf family protein [Candidatus Beckwithbacteria bacterium]|nr:septum formation protein Maf [Patescibacteria group bacterium]